MPRSSKERAPRSGQVTLGDVSVETEQYTANEVKERRWNTRATELTLPGGAYSVHVRHNDPLANGSTISVNGEEFGYGQFFSRSSRENLVRKEQDFTPAALIQNPDELTITISVSYPSSSPVNPDLL